MLLWLAQPTLVGVFQLLKHIELNMVEEHWQFLGSIGHLKIFLYTIGSTSYG
jgi:hypothetical protein